MLATNITYVQKYTFICMCTSVYYLNETPVSQNEGIECVQAYSSSVADLQQCLLGSHFFRCLNFDAKCKLKTHIYFYLSSHQNLPSQNSRLLYSRPVYLYIPTYVQCICLLSVKFLLTCIQQHPCIPPMQKKIENGFYFSVSIELFFWLEYFSHTS